MEPQICADCNLNMMSGYQPLGLAGGREVMWCPKCQQAIYGDIDPKQIFEIDGCDWCVEIYWAGASASTREIAILRKLDPCLRDRSMQTCVSEIRQSSSWRIDNLCKNERDLIIWELRQQGIAHREYHSD